MIGHANNVSNIQSPADSVEFEVPDNFVNYTLKKSKALPPISWNNWWRELNYLNLAVVGFPHVVMLYGLFTTKLRWQTALLGILYYLFTGLGQFSVILRIGGTPLPWGS